MLPHACYLYYQHVIRHQASSCAEFTGMLIAYPTLVVTNSVVAVSSVSRVHHGSPWCCDIVFACKH